MNDVPTLIDASWMVRGLGYGVVLGTALVEWLPTHVAILAGVLIVIAGQQLAYQYFVRNAAAASLRA